MKEYKACNPISTVSYIRQILNKSGFFLKEKIYENSSLFHSCKVSLHCNDLESLNICTNGKGMSLPFSLASAYAEFMERLQNDMLIGNQYFATKEFVDTLDDTSLYKKKIVSENLLLDFRHDPLEIVKDVQTTVENNDEFFINLFPFITDKSELVRFITTELEFERLTLVPFYSDKEKKEVYLPIELIHSASGSTGMCSGNTKNEALIQGFCEIFERYAGREIYFNKITPPNIPIDYFYGKKIHQIIVKFLESTGYVLKIKDCSLGLGLPVIGILVVDSNNRKYNFHIGSSLDPDVALERCLTEIHQNPNGIYWNDININIPNLIEDYTNEEYFQNGNQIFANGTGLWPYSIFGNTPSYEFTGLNYELNKTDTEDINFIRYKISEFGYNIYIRDVSFMNFNSYYIVVPGMNEYPINRDQYLVLGDTINQLRKIKNIKNIPNDEIKSMCNELNKNYHLLKMSDFKYQDLMMYHSNVDIHDLDLELLLFMLNYKIENKERAIFYINRFLENKSVKEYKYYFGIRDYVSLSYQNKSESEIQYVISMLYPEESKEILADLKNENEIFKYYEWSSCFKCEDCEISTNCKHFASIRVVKKIKKLQKDNPINHNQFIL